MSTEAIAAPASPPVSHAPSGGQPPPGGPRPPSRGRLPSLTGLRIFGSVAVVLCHVGNGFANARSLTVAEAYGYAGVSFFFMLSGFVLAWSDTPQSARRFWWLRFARIWPLQFVMMAFAYTVISSHVKSPGPLGHVAQLLLLQAWVPDNPTYAGGNGVTWSLSVEMFFYLVFPLAIMLLRRLRGRGLAVTAAVTLLLMALLCASATRDQRPRGWWLGSAPLRRLGDWSFALYLVHAPAMVFTARYGWWDNPGGLPGLASLLAFLALVIAVSAALHHLVEKPVERRLRRAADGLLR